MIELSIETRAAGIVPGMMPRLLVMMLVVSITGNVFPLVNVVAISGLLPLFAFYRRSMVASNSLVHPYSSLRSLKYAYAYWVSSYLLTCAPLAGLFSFDFLRRDGALLIAYSPLFLLRDVGLDEPFVRKCLSLFVGLMSVIAMLGVVQFAVGSLPGVGSLPESIQLVRSDPMTGHTFHGLFEAHNAAGAAYGLAALISLSLVMSSGKPRLFSLPVFCCATTVLGFLLTQSRTCYLGFVGAAGFLFFKYRKSILRFVKVRPIVILIPVLGIVWYAQSVVGSRVGATGVDDPNVLMRFVIYEKAIENVADSPLVGVGFGRFNDEDVTFSGIKHVAYVATGGQVVNGSNHAHNSYLHFLAEGGIIGFSLMMAIWLRLYRWAGGVRRAFSEDGYISAVAHGVQSCIVFEFLISFTEHLMGTAVTSLIIFTIVGLLRNLLAARNRLCSS